jgi:ubiquinone/menaquinone biosynthesis C-methylase UbiE
MVAGEGAPGAAAAELTGLVRNAYDAEPESWTTGPELAYAALARALVAHADFPVAGQRVLDLGAGTGVAGRAALAAGAAAVVAADVAVGLLRCCRPGLHPMAGDAAALPLRDRSFDVIIAAFSLTHLPSISAGLAESRRVGHALVASTFAPDWTHPAKAAIDGVLARFGYRAPAWYQVMKLETEPQLAEPLFRRRATAAGFGQLQSRTVTVPTGLSDPAQLAAWRLGMAHIAPFVRSLDPPHQAGLRRAAEAAVQGCEPLVVRMLIHSAS